MWVDSYLRAGPQPAGRKEDEIGYGLITETNKVME